MRTNLKVPFAEKDDAKKLGARWDPARKLWYVENKNDLSPFARWISDSNSAETSSASSKPSAVKKDHSSGITVVGSKFVEHPKVCECLPWEDCHACRGFTLNH